MKPKNGNYKLIYQTIKKRRQQHKNSSQSQKSESEINDDSLDLMQKSKTHKRSRINTNNNDNNNNEEINEQDLKELRTCISNQFKKSNFINFSAIKNKSNLYIEQDHNKTETCPHDNSQTKNTTCIHPHNHPKSHHLINKRNFLSSHNRSQSCPFIEPLYIYDNMSTNDCKNDDPQMVFSSGKGDKDQKKKISMQHLSKNRNRLGNTHNPLHHPNPLQPKPITTHHNYSNSLTQSSNTVIVHNIPNDIQQGMSIVPNAENLSSILYKKAQEDEQTKTQKETTTKRLTQKSCGMGKEIGQSYKKKKGVNDSQKTLQKKSLICLKQDFFIKTKLQQRMVKYQLKEEKQRVEVDSKAMLVKQNVLEKLLMPYNPANLNNKVKPTFEEAHETSINSEEKESFVVDDR